MTDKQLSRNYPLSPEVLELAEAWAGTHHGPIGVLARALLDAVAFANAPRSENGTQAGGTYQPGQKSASEGSPATPSYEAIMAEGESWREEMRQSDKHCDAVAWLNGAQVDEDGRLILTRNYIVSCLEALPSAERATPREVEAAIEAGPQITSKPGFTEYRETPQEFARRIAKMVLAPQSAIREIPAELFDGMEVYVALGEKSGISPRDVAAVLDAVVRLIRKNRG